MILDLLLPVVFEGFFAHWKLKILWVVLISLFEVGVSSILYSSRK